MSVTHQSYANRLSTGKTAKRLLGAAAVALAATTAIQRVNAATFTNAYQSITVSNTVNGTNGFQSGTITTVALKTSAGGSSAQNTALATANTTGLTITLTAGQYIAFNLGAAVTNNSNAARGAAYDTANTHTVAATSSTAATTFQEPVALGAAISAYQIATSNQNALAAQVFNGNPVVSYSKSAGFKSGYSDTVPTINPVDGEVGYAGGQYVGGGISGGGLYDPYSSVLPFADQPHPSIALTANQDGSSSTPLTDAENASFNVFSQMAFQALSVGVQTTVTLSPLTNSNSLAFVTLTTATSSLTDPSVEPSYGSRPYGSGATGGSDVYSDVPALTIVITAVPEPASLGLIGSAATLLLARRRKARLQ
jgi:hypothetical protein